MTPSDNIKYPIGIQSFSKLRENGYLYVDKTSLIFSLIQNKAYYFLSRPRRFGKSLLLSTLDAYYRGRRDLFKGLALDSLTEDWDPHPVLHLDLNYGLYKEPDDLERILSEVLDEWEKIYGVPDATYQTASSNIRFNRIIRRAYDKTGKKVVILVDEYDKPLLNTIHMPELAHVYRSQLKAFYSNLKTMDEYIEIAVLTGVARFSKVSIFSDLNNLNDITFQDKYAAICGITSDELDLYFRPSMEEMAAATGFSTEQVRAELRKRYDGYHFALSSPDIYNPFSLVNAFAANYMGDYWFSSGTPYYLVRLILNGDIPFRDIAPVNIDRRFLETAGLLNDDPIPAFYQTGYLTIKGFDPDFNEYILDYPNEEVKYAFLHFLMEQAIPNVISRRGFSIQDFVRDIKAGKPEAFMKRLESLIAAVPYNEKGSAEAHFQNAIFLLFTLMGYYTRMEDRTSDGRIDLQVETSDFIYIFEFKVDASAREALKQIRDKKYWLREQMSTKKIFLIGAAFDTGTRRLSDFTIENP